MTKQIKLVFVVLIVLIGLLAGGTGFFYAKTLSLQKNTKCDSSAKAAAEPAVQESTPKAATTSKSKEVVSTATPAPAGSRPSSPSETVTVAQGETLFAIGQKVGVSWVQIAEANGIEADKIKAGQTIIVPKNNEVAFAVNQEKAASLQKDVDGGKYAFRLSAIETAKSDAPTVYGIASTDAFTQSKMDENSGTATVTVEKGDNSFIISLVQPETKGAKGIWAIESIKQETK